MFMILFYILAISAFIVCAIMYVQPSSLNELGTIRDNGMGYLAATCLTVIVITIIESISAVLSLFRIKDDFADELYNNINKNKKG